MKSQNLKLKNYFRDTEEGGCLFIYNNGWVDINKGIKIKKGGITYRNINDERVLYLFSILEEINITYMIRGYNNEYVVTKNSKGTNRNVGGGVIHSSIIGWTKDVKTETLEYIMNNTYRIGKFTIWKRETFIQFIAECLQGDNLLRENELRKYKRSKGGGVDPKFTHEKNLFVNFLVEIDRLMSSFEEEDQTKLSNLMDRYKMDEIYTMLGLYTSDQTSFNEKISCIYRDNKYKILATFTL